MLEERPSTHASLPTIFGQFVVRVWQTENTKEIVAIMTQNFDVTHSVLLRIHSECLTGDVFGSKRCDCGEQLHTALKKISDSGNGILIYLRQEGRGIGLYEKIKAYKLQEEGLDTYEANIELGHHPDSRDYAEAVEVLKELKVTKIRLLTQNPKKVNQLKEAGFEVEKELFDSTPNAHNQAYLKAKRERFSKEV